MKVIISVCFFLFIVFALQGQNVKLDSTIRKNEIKINVLYFLAPMIELTYERVLSRGASTGVRVGLGSDDYLFEFMPYYRLYYGKKPSSGFFAEISTNAFLTRQYRQVYKSNGNSEVYSTDYINWGLGIALGKKILTKNKKNLFEIYVGIGSNLLPNNNTKPEYAIFGITYGRRF